MAFRLKPNESDRKGLERVLRNELRAAMAELATPDLTDEQIHEARKHIKKARAVLLLVRTSIRTPHARTGLRHAARLLSPMRDAHALIRNSEELCEADPRVLPQRTCTAIHRHLRERAMVVRQSAERHAAVQRAWCALNDVRRSLSSWDWSNVGRQDLEAALQQSYRNARQSMKRAKRSADPIDLHTLRKRVKALWYALRLFAGHAPALRGEIAQLERIEELLGDGHNLFVLQTKTRDRLGRDQRAVLADHLEKLQAQLRKRALARAIRFFDERPKQFGARLRALRRQMTGDQMSKMTR